MQPIATLAEKDGPLFVKCVFSRKGFDSSAGGFPSLIFPDGTLYSVPIPSGKDDVPYSDLEFHYEGEPIQSILNDLTDKHIYSNGSWRVCDYSKPEQKCHYDPMPIAHESRIRMAFGQAGASESHLRRQGVGKGDLFLFYGWFKSIEKLDGRWRFKTGAKDIHLIWAWMRVGEMICLDSPEQRSSAKDKYPFLEQHPHLSDWRGAPNQIYLADAAALLSYSDQQCLTDCEHYQGRSTWVLPDCFNHPDAFTYLNNLSPRGEQVTIKAPGRGQEFVLDLEKVEGADRSRIMDWLGELTGIDA